MKILRFLMPNFHFDGDDAAQKLSKKPANQHVVWGASTYKSCSEWMDAIRKAAEFRIPTTKVPDLPPIAMSDRINNLKVSVARNAYTMTGIHLPIGRRSKSSKKKDYKEIEMVDGVAVRDGVEGVIQAHDDSPAGIAHEPSKSSMGPAEDGSWSDSDNETTGLLEGASARHVGNFIPKVEDPTVNKTVCCGALNIRVLKCSGIASLVKSEHLITLASRDSETDEMPAGALSLQNREHSSKTNEDREFEGDELFDHICVREK